MVYIQSWQEYQDAAEALYAKSPSKTRYCIKWNSSEGKLVLKITDDSSCIKFKTHSSIFLNRFEALNLSLIQKMQNLQPPKNAPVVETAMSTSSITPVQVPTATSGGIKKKKGKKKKPS